MPLADRQCLTCGHLDLDRLEDRRQILSQTLPCPVCGNDTLERLPSAPAFRLEGYSYRNGYDRNS